MCLKLMRWVMLYKNVNEDVNVVDLFVSILLLFLVRVWFVYWFVFMFVVRFMFYYLLDIVVVWFWFVGVIIIELWDLGFLWLVSGFELSYWENIVVSVGLFFLREWVGSFCVLIGRCGRVRFEYYVIICKGCVGVRFEDRFIDGESWLVWWNERFFLRFLWFFFNFIRDVWIEFWFWNFGMVLDGYMWRIVFWCVLFFMELLGD